MTTSAELLEDGFNDPARSFGFRIWHLKHAWSRHVEAALTAERLTHMQFVLLRATQTMAGAGHRPTQARLADLLATDRMTVSKVLRLLEHKGLVARPVHPDDPRAHHVQVTPAGLAVLDRAVPLVMAAQHAFFGRLGNRLPAFSAMLDDLLAFHGPPFASPPSKEGVPAWTE